jgi:MFS family permease
MASIPVLGVVVAVLLVTASSMPMLLIPLATVLQQRTERELRGRVMGALDTVLLATLSLSFGIGGVLAETIGLLVTFAASAFAMLVLTAVIPRLPSYRRLVVEDAAGSANPL